MYNYCIYKYIYLYEDTEDFVIWTVFLWIKYKDSLFATIIKTKDSNRAHQWYNQQAETNDHKKQIRSMTYQAWINCLATDQISYDIHQTDLQVGASTIQYSFSLCLHDYLNYKTKVNQLKRKKWDKKIILYFFINELR